MACYVLQPFGLLFGQLVTLSSYLSIFFMKPANFDVQTCINTLIMNSIVIQHPTKLEYLTTKGTLTRSLFLDHFQLLKYLAHFFFMINALLRIPL
jgi:hypothetical protein